MHELRTVNYLSNREYESQASTADLFISRVIRRGSRDSSRVRVGLVGARWRLHKVTGEQVGGVNETVGLDVVGVVPGVSSQPAAECAGAHGGEFADPPVAYVAGVVRGKVRRVARERVCVCNYEP